MAVRPDAASADLVAGCEVSGVVTVTVSEAKTGLSPRLPPGGPCEVEVPWVGADSLDAPSDELVRTAELRVDIPGWVPEDEPVVIPLR